MSHTIITCTCGKPWGCPVPGHDMTPPEPVDPWVLVAAGEEALGHLDGVVRSLMKARAAWVSRGLPGDNPFPLSLDRQAEAFVARRADLRKWVIAAKEVAERRSTGRPIPKEGD